MLGKVKDELERMEQLGVITKVEEPTDCTQEERKLNEAVCREKYILPSVEQTLGLLCGAKVFSKLDANVEFWQIPLSEQSAKYTAFITLFGRFFFSIGCRSALRQHRNIFRDACPWSLKDCLG